ncbi:protein kinase [Streptomyces sp. C10-9-1]|uniref:serine/threonine protein kinase n=1 Tax=Streptomyces sp. C10-9-1 TaxID=1859285 RepID=UPI0021138DCC|nr:serine/threonine protein kinase [Streptomyces sp. C10-9-1]MCQ6555258.1 protein kinase [Streptomyces sp. C10-9-1]
MSEAEQSRESRRNEAVAAETAGRGEESAGGEGASGAPGSGFGPAGAIPGQRSSPVSTERDEESGAVVSGAPGTGGATAPEGESGVGTVTATRSDRAVDEARQAGDPAESARTEGPGARPAPGTGRTADGGTRSEAGEGDPAETTGTGAAERNGTARERAQDEAGSAPGPGAADAEEAPAGERAHGTAPGEAPSAEDPAAEAASGAEPAAEGASAEDPAERAGAGRPAESGAASAGPGPGDAPGGRAPAEAVRGDGAPAGDGSAGDAPGAGAHGKGAAAEAPSGAAAAARGATGSLPPGGTGTPATAEGRLLARRYRLGGVLGRGGMGTVWRAVDETLGRTVAVKELRFPNAIDEEEKRRLITRTLREAKAIARIRNNSAVTVFDVVDEDDRPWIVMELVEGKSLAEVIREDGVLTPRRAAEVGLAVLDVLRSAHREGILHRDVKPSNVLIGKDDRVVLTDFGIAQVEGDPSLTSTGMLVGAPSYISPERARGHKPGPAADLWSLGGLLYAAVEGSPPYDKGSAIATLTAVMTEPLDPPKNAGPLTDVVYGLLAKDPAQRLDDAGARALLTQVVNAPEEADALAAAPPEQTRVIPLPASPPPPPDTAPRPPAQPKDPAAAARVRGALRSVRNAAAAAKAEKRTPEQDPSRERTAVPAAPGGRRPAPVRAPLTDVVPRRTLVVIAVVAVLAVLSTVLVLALNGGDGNGAEGSTPGAGTGTASAGAASAGAEGSAGGEPDGAADPGSGRQPDQDGGTGGTAPGGTEDEADGDDDASDDDGAASGGTGGAGALPEGYAAVSNDQFRFTVAMPRDFRFTGIAGRNSGAKFSVDGGVPRVQIDFTDSPRDDAHAAWAAAVAGVSATSNGYRHIGITRVEYNGYPTVADWEFERNENGQRVRILNRGFKVDARRGYAIMITCKASEWDGEACTTLRRTAFATFSPKE